uniref:Uncharacterized protein n=1 Tax=Ciona savignyi TaxID=51511 RepID=H2YE25_CIOSA
MADESDGGGRNNAELALNVMFDIAIFGCLVQCCTEAWFSLMESRFYHLLTQLGIASLCYKALFCCNVWMDQINGGAAGKK